MSTICRHEHNYHRNDYYMLLLLDKKEKKKREEVMNLKRECACVDISRILMLNVCSVLFLVQTIHIDH